MKPVRILSVDDHYIVVEGIRSLLQRVSAVEILGSASDAESCMRFLDRRIPDLILLDISLPHTSGIDLCKAIHEKYPRIRILGLSTFKEQSFVRNMLDNGASGYVLKNAGIDELMIAIQTAMKGGKYLSDEVAAALSDQQIDPAAPVITRREKEVLNLIAEGYTNNEIAGRLFVSVTTVDSHRKNLLTKFGAGNTAALVKLAVKMQII